MTEITSDFESIIDQLCFEDGDAVQKHETIMNLSVMKMMIPVFAPCDGRVSYTVQMGDYVREGDVIAKVE